ncbi:conserved hypothetical protein [Gluconacetobacter diazotrophicus PA1 5]|nr:conserved hypothetical protein [Gluconacetobacter diazotrophicus PA1 5]
MTPTRLRECLVLVRWSQRGLAAALDADERLVRRWASGDADIPEAVAEWIEGLAQAHASLPAPGRWRSRETALS